MSGIKETREAWLIRVVAMFEELTQKLALEYVKDYHRIRRGAALRQMTSLPEDRGLKCFFIDNDLRGLKQNFYVYCKLLMAAEQEVEPCGDAFATYASFLYGLLSDSPEVYDWLTHADLKEKNTVKTPHFLFHQFQLVLRRDDEALRQTIALVAKKGRKQDKILAQAGQDFFSLLLKQDKEGLQALIENQAKIKSVNELEGQFLAGFAVVHAKLPCGINHNKSLARVLRGYRGNCGTVISELANQGQRKVVGVVILAHQKPLAQIAGFCAHYNRHRSDQKLSGSDAITATHVD